MMTLNIKLILAAGALLAGALLAWYVQGLHADNERLASELAISQALSSARARQLEVMGASAATLEAARQAGESETTGLQKQISQARALGREKGDDHATIESSVALIIAERLNSLSRP